MWQQTVVLKMLSAIFAKLQAAVGRTQRGGGLCNSCKGAFEDPNSKTALVCTKARYNIGISWGVT